MEHEASSTSLIEHLAETGFRSSLIATYNCYFPFYEDVVLRRLIASGCTHNVLMVDANCCAEAFGSEDLRPRRAGRDYTLIPVKIGGAFHPKIFLRLGKSKGSLLVGSHNLTLSGFGLNDEVTNVFRAEGTGIRSQAGPLRQAFEYLLSFVPVSLPEVVESFAGLKLGIPWMDGPHGTGDSDRVLLTSTNIGADLWSQVARILPSNVSMAFICGPFFDPELALVQRIQREVHPREFVIGIDPASVEINPDAAISLTNVRWVNIAGVPQIPKRRDGSYHYLHAKIFWFASEQTQLLITGSANPSVAAFFAQATRRNAEAVVADSRTGVDNEIGINALVEAPPITEADWTVVKVRRSSTLKRQIELSRRIVMATPTPTGFRTQDALPLGLTVRGLGNGGLDLGEAVVRELTTIEAPDAVRDGACCLEGALADEHLLVLVHRTEDIAKNIGGDIRKSLRQAIGALEEDPSQLEALLKLTEKVIFDSDDIVRASTSLRPTAGPVEATELLPVPSSLALDAAGRRVAHHKQSLASGDIVVLLDALIRRLGEGLPSNAAPRPRNDQDEIDADEEEGGEFSREVPDFKVLSTACRRKVRSLVRRMERQFEKATVPHQALRCIVQLAAVLGVIRTLRIVEQRPEWRRAHLALVDPDEERRLFKVAVLATIWGSDALAHRALAATDGEWFEELSMVTGLLAWMAWDAGVDIEDVLKITRSEEVGDEVLYFIQLLAALGPWLTDDVTAETTLKESVSRTPRLRVDEDKWLCDLKSRLRCVAQVAADPDRHGQTGRLPRFGDLVVLSNRESQRVRVVLKVMVGSRGREVIIYDPRKQNGKGAYLVSHVATMPWTTGSGTSAVSA